MPEAIEKEQIETAQVSLENEELEAKKERLARMAIENPAEYEELLVSGDLEDTAQGESVADGTTAQAHDS